jgi:translation initiation factor 2 subunit 1
LESYNEDWPEVGECVIATIKNITPYGAYVFLDEYKKEGLLHISEISSSWIRNIRSFVREGQKAVLKVLRTDTEKGHIDLSLRRVSGKERKETLLFWKQDRRAVGLLRSATEKLNISYEEIYEKAGALIEKEYGLYEGLEKTAREGSEFLLELGIPEKIAIVLEDISKEKIKPSIATIKGVMELKSTKPDGVVLIQDALLYAKKIAKDRGINIKIQVLAAPKYRIEVSAINYKEAQRVLKTITETAIKKIKAVGGQGKFELET